MPTVKADNPTAAAAAATLVTFIATLRYELELADKGNRHSSAPGREALEPGRADAT
jgi:hypothetical protein